MPFPPGFVGYDGYIYIAPQSSSVIHKLTPEGVIVQTYTHTTAIDSPSWLDTVGFLWFTASIAGVNNTQKVDTRTMTLVDGYAVPVSATTINPIVIETHPGVVGGYGETIFGSISRWGVFPPSRVSPDRVGVGAIIGGICAEAGLTPSQIDTFDIANITDGYVLANRMSCRAALESLSRAYSFDAVEDGPVVKFVTRGKRTPVEILSEECVLENVS